MNGFMMVIVTAFCLVYLTPVIYYLPRSVLGAIIIRAAWNLVDTSTFRVLWKAWKPYRLGGMRRDMIVWLAALLLTVLCGVMYGIMGAVVISVTMLVKDSAMPRVVTLCQLESQYGAWRDATVFHEGLTFPGVLVIELRGPMTFASADHFQEELEHTREVYNLTSGYDLKVIVLSFASVHDLDPTALSMLKDLLSAWRKQGVSCIAAETKARVRLLIEENFGDWAHVRKGEEPLLKQSRFIITIDAAVNEALHSRSFNPSTEPRTKNHRRRSEGNAAGDMLAVEEVEAPIPKRPHSLSDCLIPPSPDPFERGQLSEPLLAKDDRGPSRQVSGQSGFSGGTSS
jgi:MFS superfamily sulfate permease-like transporter